MKYFITSDVHSFYTPLKTALHDAGFDINNPEHILIVNGDLFDRGEETMEVYNFIKSIPKERRVLIRGNHEYLLRDLLNKDYPQAHDLSNGTVKTVFSLAGCIPAHIEGEEPNDFNFYFIDPSGNDLNELYGHITFYAEWNDGVYPSRLEIPTEDIIAWKNLAQKVKDTGIIEWIFSDEWVDYYELDNYIITHAFIPLKVPAGMSMYRPDISRLEYVPTWRTTTDREGFEKATWGCPYGLYDAGLFLEEEQNGKTLICGHWHSFDFRQHYYHVYYRTIQEIDFDIFYTKHLIALDACTAASDKCNVLVIENGVCYANGIELEDEIEIDTTKSKLERREYFI